MSMAAAVSLGNNKLGFKYEGGDLSISVFKFTIDLFWHAHWSGNGLYICKDGTEFDRHWTWVEIVHRLKFWRRGEVQWPAPTEEDRRRGEALGKAAAANGEPWPPHK